MDITFSCTYCGGRLVVDDSGAGLIVPCPKCGQDVMIPVTSSTPDVDPPQSSPTKVEQLRPMPEFAEGYIVLRDNLKRFVTQVRQEDFIGELSKNNWPMDYEMQLSKNGCWIPLEDIIVSYDDEQRAKAELGKRSPQQVLLRASKDGDYELIKWALAYGVHVESNDNEALYLALTNNHEKCVRLLVNRGAIHLSQRHIHAAVALDSERVIAYVIGITEESVSIMFASALKAKKDKLSKQLEEMPVKRRALESQRPLCHCPNCHLGDGRKINAWDRLLGAGFIASAGKQYICSHCGHMW